MNNFIDIKALDAHFASIARKTYLEEHAKEAGVSKRELQEMVRTLVQQRVFNLKSAAKYLGHSQAWVIQRVNKGEIKVHFNGKSKFYCKEDLDEWIDQSRVY